MPRESGSKLIAATAIVLSSVLGPFAVSMFCWLHILPKTDRLCVIVAGRAWGTLVWSILAAPVGVGMAFFFLVVLRLQGLDAVVALILSMQLPLIVHFWLHIALLAELIRTGTLRLNGMATPAVIAHAGRATVVGWEDAAASVIEPEGTHP